MNTNEKDPAAGIMQIIFSGLQCQVLRTAVELEIADVLTGGAMTLSELAERVGAEEDALARIMQALLNAGFFSASAGCRYELNEAGGFLRKDRMGPIIRMFTSEWHQQAWLELPSSVRSGRPAFETAHGLPAFEWLSGNPKAADIFNSANSVKAGAAQAAAAAAYDFSGCRQVIDVGGGCGGLVISILRQNPGLNAVIADLPHVTKQARSAVSDSGFGDRCCTAECDFFESVPSGGDCLILSNILHDWDDERCRIILKNCRRVMNEGARLLVIESLLPEQDKPSPAFMMDLEMMVMGGGRERTEAEYLCLLEKAGLYLVKRIDAGDNVSLLVCGGC